VAVMCLFQDDQSRGQLSGALAIFTCSYERRIGDENRNSDDCSALDSFRMRHWTSSTTSGELGLAHTNTGSNSMFMRISLIQS